MVATIQKKNTERQKLDYLETWEKHLKNSAPPPGKKKPRAPLKTKLFSLMDTENGLLKLLNQGGRSADGNKSITNINQLDFEPVDADRLITLSKLIQECLKPLLTQSRDMLNQIDPIKKKRR
jgi:hypothetical protein